MEMKDIVALIVFAVMGIGVLMGIANNLLYTQQSTISVNKTLTFVNNSPIQLETSYALVPGSETVYGGNGSAEHDGVGIEVILNEGRNYSMNYAQALITTYNETDIFWYNSSTESSYPFNITYQYYPTAYISSGIIRSIYAAILPLLAIMIIAGLWWYFRNV